jgi:hypothetical protein
LLWRITIIISLLLIIQEFHIHLFPALVL